MARQPMAEEKCQRWRNNSQFNDAGEHFMLGDVHEIPADSVPSVTLATASFPCKDLSLAGSRSGLCGKQSSAS
ncbi:DNA cytosine methyltransferase [Pelotomaculum sp. FP]|uniref:DNA cytosine methyltransferase n=1 Tax=Pelotomaculum sp. FP TaxID=261474 RepID=UPI001FA94650|nr:DNA cytosine methyltransferase [Pelotomaculum sp. FP]